MSKSIYHRVLKGEWSGARVDVWETDELLDVGDSSVTVELTGDEQLTANEAARLARMLLQASEVARKHYDARREQYEINLEKR